MGLVQAFQHLLMLNTVSVWVPHTLVFSEKSEVLHTNDNDDTDVTP